jgi:hypothetical protein
MLCVGSVVKIFILSRLARAYEMMMNHYIQHKYRQHEWYMNGTVGKICVLSRSIRIDFSHVQTSLEYKEDTGMFW